MQLIEGLTSIFEDSDKPNDTRSKPKSLQALIAQLEQSHLSNAADPPELSQHCEAFSTLTESTRLAHQQEMTSARGYLEEMWQDQTLIYQELVAALRYAADLCRELRWSELPPSILHLTNLTRDLEECLLDVQRWKNDHRRRCLQCGWDEDETQMCPNCELRLMRPAKNRKTDERHSSRRLDGFAALLFEGIRDVISGHADVIILSETVATMLDFYRTMAYQLTTLEPELQDEALSGHLKSLVDGLDIIATGVRNQDAQCLVDGWRRFFIEAGKVQQLTGDSGQHTETSQVETPYDSVFFEIDD